MSKTLWIVIAVIAVVLVGAWWFMMKNGQPVQAPEVVPSASATSAMMESASPEGTDSAMQASGQNFTVSGSEFMFAPMTLTAKVGEPVTITFKNTGTYPHNFTISELNVATKTVQPGASDSVTFTPAKAGTYTYFCSVDSHEEKGMKGTLTVQ